MGSDHRVLRCGLMVVVLILIEALPAMGQSTPPPEPTQAPARNLDLMMLVNDDGNRWEMSRLEKEPFIVERFPETDIRIFVGVTGSRRTGALSIKVERYFQGGEPAVMVDLYRGGGFRDRNRRNLARYDGSSPFSTYQEFHGQERLNPALSRDFHAYWAWDRRSHTAGRPYPRKSFVFGRLGATERPTFRRSYLLHYQISPSRRHSWIPFTIGTGGRDSGQLERIEIIVTDLAARSPDAEVLRRVEKRRE